MDRRRLAIRSILVCLGLFLPISSCTYMQNVAKQANRARIQESNPSQRNLKHMIDRQNFFVYGRIVDDTNSYAGLRIAVGAFSDRYESHELVDINHVARTGTHYGLNLPDGLYELLVFADQDQDGVLNESEVVARRRIELSDVAFPEKVAGDTDLWLSAQVSADWAIEIAVPETAELKESVFFPQGSIRELNDPLFDPAVATLGVYEPAAFLEQAPTMFFALEEESYKIPIVFVHGIGGSVREFAPVIAELERSRYKPWFFYYPSGNDLEQLAEMFYSIFISGQLVRQGIKPIIVVAHSMGGLVVREALNKVRGNDSENRVTLVITIASPFGGHPGAALGEEHGPLVVPSWRDLNPGSPFIERLFRNPLPSYVSHHLLFTYGNPDTLKLGENSDGVVPLSSQLRPIAQRQAAEQFGFNDSHAGVLADPEAIQTILQSIRQFTPDYPESHINAILAGGFDADLDEGYSDQEKYYVRTLGTYMSLLANGELDTLDDPILEHFVEAAQGRAEAGSGAETAWLKFCRDYPDYTYGSSGLRACGTL